MMDVFNLLLEEYGPQGWWPCPDYRPGDFRKPETETQRLEICIGAILTQNTSWKNVQKAIQSLKVAGVMSVQALLETEKERLAELIRPSGYYNQKAENMKQFIEIVSVHGLNEFLENVSREELLKIKGIGPETADSILLYAVKRPHFVVDAYTRRIFSRLGIVKENEKYETIKMAFEKSLPRKHEIYNEYHALIVEHAKRFCKKKPECEKCLLKIKCGFRSY